MAALARAFTGEASSPLVKAVRDFLGHLAHRGASVNTIAAYRSDLEQLAYFVETHRAAAVIRRLTGQLSRSSSSG